MCSQRTWRLTATTSSCMTSIKPKKSRPGSPLLPRFTWRCRGNRCVDDVMLSSVSVEWPCLVWIQLTEIFWTWTCRPESSFHCAPNWPKLFWWGDIASYDWASHHVAAACAGVAAWSLQLSVGHIIILVFTMHPPVHTIDIYRYLHRFHRCMDDKICIWTNVKHHP